MTISDELRDGIAIYRRRYDALAGQRVRATRLGGLGGEVVGTLRDTAAGCQPYVVTDDDPRVAIDFSTVRRVEVQS